MKFKNEEVWKKAVEKNSDFYGRGIIRYAENWANTMEECLSRGESVTDCAERTSRSADTEGITGFMYGCAVSILSEVWEYGEDLRHWHNLNCQINTEGEEANESGGVLNPAILVIAE